PLLSPPRSCRTYSRQLHYSFQENMFIPPYLLLSSCLCFSPVSSFFRSAGEVPVSGTANNLTQRSSPLTSLRQAPGPIESQCRRSTYDALSPPVSWLQPHRRSSSNWPP